MKKRSLVLVISLFLLLGMLLSTVSAASQVQPRYTKIHTITSELLSINWLGKATFCGTADSLDPSCLLELCVELQRSEDGFDGWDTIETWSTTGYEDVIIDTTHYVGSGYYYRIVTVVIAYDSNGYFIESNAIPSAVLYH